MIVERSPFNSLVTVNDGMQAFGLLYPGEKQLLTFSFGPVLLSGNLLILTAAPTVKATCVYGNDGDPQGIIQGAAVVNREPLILITPTGGQIVLPAQTAVQVAVQASAIPDATYVIAVTAASNVSTILPICAGRLSNYP